MEDYISEEEIKIDLEELIKMGLVREIIEGNIIRYELTNEGKKTIVDLIYKTEGKLN